VVFGKASKASVGHGACPAGVAKMGVELTATSKRRIPE
jgi:hypothetical protein